MGGVAGQDLGIGELLGREPEPRAAGADRLPPRCGLRALGARSRPRNVLSPARRGGGEELGLAGGAARSAGGGGGGTGGGRGRGLLRPLTAPSCGPPRLLQAEVAALTREGPAGWNLDSHQLQCPSAARAHPRGGSLGSQVPSGDSPSHTSVPGVQSKRGPNAGAEPRTKVTKSLPAGVCVPRCLRRARASRDRPRPRRMSRHRGWAAPATSLLSTAQPSVCFLPICKMGAQHLPLGVATALSTMMQVKDPDTAGGGSRFQDKIGLRRKCLYSRPL